MNSVSFNDILKENQLLRTQLGQKQRELVELRRSLVGVGSGFLPKESNHTNLQVENERLKSRLESANKLNRELTDKIQLLDELIKMLPKSMEESQKPMEVVEEKVEPPKPGKIGWKERFRRLVFRNDNAE